MSTVLSAVEYPVNPKPLDLSFVFMFWYANDDQNYGQVFSIADGEIKVFMNTSFQDVFDNQYAIYVNQFFATFTHEDDIDRYQHFCIKNDTISGTVSFFFNGKLIKTTVGNLPPATKTVFTAGPTKTIDLFDIRFFSGDDALVINEDVLEYYINDTLNNSGNKTLPYA